MLFNYMYQLSELKSLHIQTFPHTLLLLFFFSVCEVGSQLIHTSTLYALDYKQRWYVNLVFSYCTS